MNIQRQVQSLDTLAAALSRAASIREKVKLANSIFETLGECEKLLEQFIASEVGHPNGNKSNTVDASKNPGDQHDLGITTPRSTHSPTAKKFKGMSLAEVGRALLMERGVMHGSEIESIAKAGGFSGKAAKFQSYLAVAFKRDGGFENLGKNNWKLRAAAPAAPSGSMTSE